MVATPSHPENQEKEKNVGCSYSFFVGLNMKMTSSSVYLFVASAGLFCPLGMPTAL